MPWRKSTLVRLSAPALSLAVLLSGSTTGLAATVQVLNYTMPNGDGMLNWGSFNYFGWKYIDPTITFTLANNSGVSGISVAIGLSPQSYASYVLNGNVVLGAGL